MIGPSATDSSGSSRVRALTTDDRGQAAVEFALVASVFLLLVSLVVQGAFLFNAWLTVTNAAREGARNGAPCYQRSVAPCSTSDILNVVDNASTGLDSTQLSASVTSTGGILTVQVSYNVPILAPFLEQILPNPVVVTADSAMRLENGGN